MNHTPSYFNGQFLPLEDIHISPLDRGFLFGDGVYAVIPVYHFKPFALNDHLERFRSNLQSIRLPLSLSNAEFAAIFDRLIQTLATPYQSIYLQVTRGAMPKRHHVIPETCNPTIMAFVSPWIRRDYTQGSAQKVYTAEDIRWGKSIKSTSLLPNILLRDEAARQGGEDTILILPETTPQGDARWLTEATSANVFIVKDGHIKTPWLTDRIQGGVTRKQTLLTCLEADIPVLETQVSEEDLFQADEIWLTSALREILPVTHLNDQLVGNGQPGPMWHTVHQAWEQRLIEKLGQP